MQVQPENNFYLLFFAEFPMIFIPIIIDSIYHLCHYYSIPMPSPIISVILFKLLLSVAIRSTAFLLADKWIHPVCLTLILPRNSSQFFLHVQLFICCYIAFWLYFITLNYFSFQ